MRRLGAMPYMTPLQRATESSTTPKSVMKTTVGGGSTADCRARRGIAIRSKKAIHKQNNRADFRAGVNVIRIKSNSPERLPVYIRPGGRKEKTMRHRSASGIYNRDGNQSFGNKSIQEPAMPNVIPEKYADLFEKRAFASLGTLMPDGRPQVTPVWCDFDGQPVIFNSARGRQ